MSAWINEFHYENAVSDTGEFIEIAGVAGLDLSTWSVVLYNGGDGQPYSTLWLAGQRLLEAGGGYGFLVLQLPTNGLQNGAPDGIALYDGQRVVQFLSYEGAFVATSGVAAGMTSVASGVSQSGTEPIGSSLQMTGAGTGPGDFTWVATTAKTAGALNTGQMLIGPAGVLAIGDAAVTEGDSGEQLLVFTVTRQGGTEGAVDAAWSLTLGTGDTAAEASDFLAPLATSGRVAFAAGQSLAYISLEVLGDTTFERDETFTLTLSDPTGGVLLLDAQAIGTLRNDDVPQLAVFQIQGAGHRSPYAGVRVATQGVVTAVDTNGFHLQDPTGDGEAATSDAVFVVTGTKPSVLVGDSVRLIGTVIEHLPGGASSGNLTQTRLTLAGLGEGVTVLASGQALPAATVLGSGGRALPDRVIEDEGLTDYQPALDGLDFWESLESMRVSVSQGWVVAPTGAGGGVWVVADGGAGASGLSARGALGVDGGSVDAFPGRRAVTDPDADFNPERILINDDRGQLPGFFSPLVDVGARLGEVTGVVACTGGHYEVRPVTRYVVEAPSTLPREVSTLERTSSKLLVASYNLHNLAPNDTDGDADVANGQFASIGGHIALNLRAPDILALQEVQDDDGSVDSATVSASLTLQTLVDAIARAGGPQYAWIDNPFITDDRSGGDPGGNIRTALLYNPARVGLVAGSVATIGLEGQTTDAQRPFYNARLPLVASFSFAGQTVTVVNNHLTGKGASSPLHGELQPPKNGGETKRLVQAQSLHDSVAGWLAGDPAMRVVVLGDSNEIETESPMHALEGSAGTLRNLTWALPEDECYSFIFEGNAQSLDHVLVSGAPLPGAALDVVHLNSEFTARASDHDPLPARLDFNRAPQGTVSVQGEARVGQTLSAVRTLADPDGLGAFAWQWTPNEVAIGGATTASFVPTTAELGKVLRVVVSYTEAGGTGEQVTSAPTTAVLAGTNRITGTAAAETLHGTAGNDELLGLAGNDTLNGNGGEDTLDGGAGAHRLAGGTGNDRHLVDLNANGALQDTVSESSGAGVDTLTLRGGSTNTKFVTLTLGANLEHLDAAATGSSRLNLTGNVEANLLVGNLAANAIAGGAGADTLVGGGGDDTLRGQTGADELRGGEGRDRFAFQAGDSGQSTGHDRIADFALGAAGSGEIIDFSVAMTVGGSGATATATQASINPTTGIATFAAGSVSTLAEALSRIASRFTAATDSAGELALFPVPVSDPWHLFISDGRAGVTTGDVVVQLLGVPRITGFSLSSGDLGLAG